jgi:hypothetical protein
VTDFVSCDGEVILATRYFREFVAGAVGRAIACVPDTTGAVPCGWPAAADWTGSEEIKTGAFAGVAGGGALSCGCAGEGDAGGETDATLVEGVEGGGAGGAGGAGAEAGWGSAAGLTTAAPAGCAAAIGAGGGWTVWTILDGGDAGWTAGAGGAGGSFKKASTAPVIRRQAADKLEAMTPSVFRESSSSDGAVPAGPACEA